MLKKKRRKIYKFFIDKKVVWELTNELLGLYMKCIALCSESADGTVDCKEMNDGIGSLETAGLVDVLEGKLAVCKYNLVTGKIYQRVKKDEPKGQTLVEVFKTLDDITDDETVTPILTVPMVDTTEDRREKESTLSSSSSPSYSPITITVPERKREEQIASAPEVNKPTEDVPSKEEPLPVEFEGASDGHEEDKPEEIGKDVFKVLSAYRRLIGVPDGKEADKWMKNHSKRWARPARKLVDEFDGRLEDVAQCMIDTAKEMSNGELEWTLDTVARRAPQWRVEHNDFDTNKF